VVETTRRREIEDVASSLFRERGYSGTSVRDIARALDIQGASLYAHVASKQDVLWAIVDRMATRFETAADEAIATADTEPDAGARTSA
jgi:AcrR family transcriptional regulator